MVKISLAVLLILSYAAFSVMVYTRGTESPVKLSDAAKKKNAAGKRLFQQHNCQSCHQVYGLGGYLGPDLTKAWSDPARGEAYMKAMLTSGSSRMPDFHFKPAEIEAIISYLKYVDATTAAIKYPGSG